MYVFFFGQFSKVLESSGDHVEEESKHDISF